MTLAERLKLLVALVEGLSLRELAELIEVSPAYPSLIASGARPNIRANIAQGIARVFGTTIDFVLNGVGQPPTVEQAVAAIAEARKGHAARVAAKAAAEEAPPASERNPTPGAKEAS